MLYQAFSINQSLHYLRLILCENDEDSATYKMVFDTEHHFQILGPR